MKRRLGGAFGMAAQAARGARAQKKLRARLAAVSRVKVVPALMRSAGELKSMDTSLTIAGPVIATTSTNADSFTLNLIQPGTASFNRIGRKVRLHALRLFGALLYQVAPVAVTANVADSILRMVVVWDKQPSGAVPTFDTIFGTTVQTGTEATGFLDPLKYDSMGRFKVIRDLRYESKMQTFTSGGSTNVFTNVYKFDEFIKLKGLEANYSGQSSPQTIADISSGALYVFFRAFNSVADVTDWSVDASSRARLTYVD